MPKEIPLKEQYDTVCIRLAREQAMNEKLYGKIEELEKSLEDARREQENLQRKFHKEHEQFISCFALSRLDAAHAEATRKFIADHALEIDEYRTWVMKDSQRQEKLIDSLQSQVRELTAKLRNLEAKNPNAANQTPD